MLLLLQGVLPAIRAKRELQGLPLPVQQQLRHNDPVTQMLSVLPVREVRPNWHGDQLGDVRRGTTAVAKEVRSFPSLVSLHIDLSIYLEVH